MADKTWLGGDSAGENSANVAANWSPSGVPSGSDNVYFNHRSTTSLTADLGTLAAVTGELHVDAGFTKQIGNSTGLTYFEMKPSVVHFSGVNTALIDLKASTGIVNITNTAQASFGLAGLNLLGSALTRINMQNGNVGLATNPGQTSTVAEIEMLRTGVLVLGEGATWTNAMIYGGTVTAVNGTTNSVVNLYNGTFSAGENYALKELNTFGGISFLQGSGTAKSITMRGGTVDTLHSGTPRTVTDLTLHSGSFHYDSTVVTLTNFNGAGRPVTLTVDEK